jgi:Leucine-rich repeat (LRR) protein
LLCRSSLNFEVDFAFTFWEAVMPAALAYSLFVLLTVLLSLASFALAFAAFSALGAPAETFPANSWALKSVLALLAATPLLVAVCALWAFGKVRAVPAIASFWPLLIPIAFGTLLSVSLGRIEALRPVTPIASAPAEDSALAAWLAARPGIKEVTIRDAGLTRVPAPLLTLGSLEVLNLAGNRIAALPDELGRLPRLRMLYLNGNPIAQSEVRRWIGASGYGGAVNQ